MKMGDKIYISCSKINNFKDYSYNYYKEYKSNLIVKPNKPRLHPHLKDNPMPGYIEDENIDYDRDVDTEYKFFEFIYEKALRNELSNERIIILSEKSMCFSCNSAYNELVDKLKEIDCNLNINVVSGKRNDLWMYRKYSDTELDKKMAIKRNKRKKGGKK